MGGDITVLMAGKDNGAAASAAAKVAGVSAVINADSDIYEVGVAHGQAV